MLRLIEIFQVMRTLQLDGHENFLIVLKGKTQVNNNACYRQGLLNLDHALELLKELKKKTKLMSGFHTISMKSEGWPFSWSGDRGERADPLMVLSLVAAGTHKGGHSPAW